MVTRGFTLIEVIVSLAVLGICIVGVTGAAILAAHTLGAAHAKSEAALLLASIADSLLLEPAPASGSRVEGRHRVVWTVAGAPDASRIELSASDTGGRALPDVALVLLHAPPPPRMGGRP